MRGLRSQEDKRLLTALQTKFLCLSDLSWSQWNVINLQASDSSLKKSLAAFPGSHSCRILSGQTDLSDSFSSDFSGIDKNSSISRSLVVGSSNKVPGLRLDQVGFYRGSESSQTIHEAYQQNSRTNHPHVNVKAVRFVIKNWTNWTIRIDPSYNGHRLSSVEAAIIGKFDIAV